MKDFPLDGEGVSLDRVSFHPTDDAARREYAEWLSGKDDRRADFLRKFVDASQSMNAGDFPVVPEDMSEEWVELIGYRLLERAAANGFPELKTPLLTLARPALRMIMTPTPDDSIPVGASKIGGLPDLPPDFVWPLGKQCRAIYNLDTSHVEEPAGFVVQINLAQIADTQAARDLPAEGMLTFFSYVESDNPDVIGAMAVLFTDCSNLARTPIPENATDGNREMPAQRLTFVETLDVPGSGGPWDEDLNPDQSKSEEYWMHFYEALRDLNQFTFLGYGKSYQEVDPTPSKDSRHLLMVENADGEMLHIQIPEQELAARNFSAITLNWVDFD